MLACASHRWAALGLGQSWVSKPRRRTADERCSNLIRSICEQHWKESSSQERRPIEGERKPRRIESRTPEMSAWAVSRAVATSTVKSYGDRHQDRCFPTSVGTREAFPREIARVATPRGQ